MCASLNGETPCRAGICGVRRRYPGTATLRTDGVPSASVASTTRAACPPRIVAPIVSDQSRAKDSRTDGRPSSHAACPSASAWLRTSSGTSSVIRFVVPLRLARANARTTVSSHGVAASPAARLMPGDYPLYCLMRRTADHSSATVSTHLAVGRNDVQRPTRRGPCFRI
jgi:hypothetical protein